ERRWFPEISTRSTRRTFGAQTRQAQEPSVRRKAPQRGSSPSSISAPLTVDGEPHGGLQKPHSTRRSGQRRPRADSRLYLDQETPQGARRWPCIVPAALTSSAAPTACRRGVRAVAPT